MARDILTLNVNSRTKPSAIKKFFALFSKSITKTVNVSKYEIAKAIFEEEVGTTPVLTGWARASWSAGINKAEPKNIPRPTKKIVISKGNTAASVASDFTGALDDLEAADANPTKASEKRKKLPPPKFGVKNPSDSTDVNEEYEILNDAPHIFMLAAGHSPQAQAGWVEIAADRGVQKASRIMKNKRIKL